MRVHFGIFYSNVSSLRRPRKSVRHWLLRRVTLREETRVCGLCLGGGTRGVNMRSDGGGTKKGAGIGHRKNFTALSMNYFVTTATYRPSVITILLSYINGTNVYRSRHLPRNDDKSSECIGTDPVWPPLACVQRTRFARTTRYFGNPRVHTVFSTIRSRQACCATRGTRVPGRMTCRADPSRVSPPGV